MPEEVGNGLPLVDTPGCVRCGKKTSDSRGYILTCQTCKQRWHHNCCEPKLTTLQITLRLQATELNKPEKGMESWKCKGCTDKALGKQPDYRTTPYPAIIPSSRPIASTSSVPLPLNPAQIAPWARAPGRARVMTIDLVGLSQRSASTRCRKTAVASGPPIEISSDESESSTSSRPPKRPKLVLPATEIIDLTEDDPPAAPSTIAPQAPPPRCRSESTNPSRPSSAQSPNLPSRLPWKGPLLQKPPPTRHPIRFTSVPSSSSSAYPPSSTPSSPFSTPSSLRPFSRTPSSSRTSLVVQTPPPSRTTSAKPAPSVQVTTQPPRTATPKPRTHWQLSFTEKVADVCRIVDELRRRADLPRTSWPSVLSVDKDSDVDMLLTEDDDHARNKIVQRVHDVDIDVEMDIDKATVADRPSHKVLPRKSNTPKHGVRPDYLLMFRDHEKFARMAPPPPVREHRLPRKGVATKLGRKAKRKKQRKLLTYLGDLRFGVKLETE
ncbi:hypothetical protein BXZ70DRAFT_621554 [Cristinia sonorae]|uniref:PHD-type domain-containing protein n=1 Tax=Cristinia sonorae TaxID=1940300 RepID=A0A8K0UX48_9AGAR|nr:hypothetical protein BXZ70DRAFT_621554 [Cristinia sonorae]